jgi:hypothetical protein
MKKLRKMFSPVLSSGVNSGLNISTAELFLLGISLSYMYK